MDDPGIELSSIVQQEEEDHEQRKEPIATTHNGNDTASTVLYDFTVFSIAASLVPAAALACLSLATARLGSNVGASQTGILYLFYTLSALTGISTLLVQLWNSRNAVLFGMILYSVYVIYFFVGATEQRMSRFLAWAGAAVGGLGAGIFWTAQGVYFSQAAEAYKNANDSTVIDPYSPLAGRFACILLVCETLLDVLSTVLVRWVGVSWQLVFALYALIVVAAILVMWCKVKIYVTSRSNSATSTTRNYYCSKATAALALLVNDGKMKYFLFYNAAFGLCAAFLNSFVSGEVVRVALGDDAFVGVLVAVHGGVAALASLSFGYVVAPLMGKGSVLVIGAVAFGCVASSFLIQPNLERWNWGGLILIYSLEGVGRASYEGELKAIFADYFHYEKEGAFGNIILQNGLSSGLAYFLSIRMTCTSKGVYCIVYKDGSLHNLLLFASIVILTSIAAILGYWRASYLHNIDLGRSEQQSIKPKQCRSAHTYSYESLQSQAVRYELDNLPYVS